MFKHSTEVFDPSSHLPKVNVLKFQGFTQNKTEQPQLGIDG